MNVMTLTHYVEKSHCTLNKHAKRFLSFCLSFNDLMHQQRAHKGTKIKQSRHVTTNSHVLVWLNAKRSQWVLSGDSVLLTRL